MLPEERYIKEAATYLSILSNYTATVSKLNLNDNSVISENFFARLLNLVYGYRLENLNKVQQNAAVIDLYDDENRLSVQVTSQSKSSKIKSCLSNFQKNELHKHYDTLLIYILTDKQKNGYSVDEVSIDKFNFKAKEHILDKSDLLKEMLNKTPEVQKEVVDILKKFKNLLEDDVIVSNEERTIIDLIGLLSINQKASEFDSETEIDPKRKIAKRFKEDAILIEDQYFNLCLEYAPVLNAVEENNDIDSAKHSRVAAYLKDKSSMLLVHYNFDAMAALNKLIEDVTKLFHESKVDYDKMAIKFFLLKSLTECHVFPLLRSERCA